MVLPQLAHAEVLEIPGSDDVNILIDVNDRGDVLWLKSAAAPNTLMKTSPDGQGGYVHVAVNDMVSATGSAVASLSSNGDITWSGYASGQPHIFFYDDSTGTASQLTPPGTVRPWGPVISGNGDAAWTTQPSLYSNMHVEYYTKSDGLITRLTASASAVTQPAMNHGGDAFWFEKSGSGDFDLRKYDAEAQTTSTLLVRPIGTTLRRVHASESGDVAWIEVVAGEGIPDLFLYDARDGSVERITNSTHEENNVQFNRAGDLVWNAVGDIWFLDRRTQQPKLIDSAQAANSGNFALSDMGETAWSDQVGLGSEVRLFSNATNSYHDVVGVEPYQIENHPKMNAAGDLYFRVEWITGGVTQSRIVRATRQFECN